MYSPSKEAAYCLCCLMFSPANAHNRSSLATAEGFRNWKKLEKITMHENSPSHRQCFTTWKDAQWRLTNAKGVDAVLEEAIASEKERWRDVLQRIISCIQFLAKQNLPLRGHYEKLDASESSNSGHFLELLKLLAQYDPVLKSHLKHAEENPRSVSYLSPQIQNEFIHLLASSVHEQLIDAIVRNKYYGILFDSTPDIAHREQFSEVIRYVDINFERKTAEIKESFLGFIQLYSKDAASLEEVILQRLEEDRIPLTDCRSQCYDNAAVMSGAISGVQKRITDRNPRALFLNCDNHSLNLAGLHAANQEASVVTFFGTIEALYVFFSQNTVRWDLLKTAVKRTLKQESPTRWSARYEAVNVVFEHLDSILELLEEMSESPKLTLETKTEAGSLAHRMLTFDFLSFLYFWDQVLRRIERVQKRLQDPTMNFADAANDLDCLQQDLGHIRDDLCAAAIADAKQKCNQWGIIVERRRRRRRRMTGELAEDAGLSAEEEQRRVLVGAIDRLQVEFDNRFQRLRGLNTKFGFLLDVAALMSDSAFDCVEEQCANFGEFYATDVDATGLYNDIVDCRMLLRSRENVIRTPIELLRFLIQYGKDVFPNLRVALQILLTVSVSIASCERSFSKLKLILTYLRASMEQQRLSDLALLSIEKETLESVEVSRIIDKFASMKARKVHI